MKMTTSRMTTLTIEQLWRELRAAGGDAQRRIDENHPLDLYADYELPNRPGLVAVCGSPVAHIQPLRALRITQGARTDGRWSLRISLNEPALEPVFAALCRDIVSQTRTGVSDTRLGPTVLARIDRWRTLLDRDAGGLGDLKLRGLFGELFVLQVEVLARHSPRAAVLAWVGPTGSPQDFILPSGDRLEVKTAEPTASTVTISSIEQLDCPSDPLKLIVLRAEKTGAQALGAVGLMKLIAGLRERFSEDPEALADFDAALLSMEWHEHASHDAFAMRPLSIEAYDVGPGFPRLVRDGLPRDVVAAQYEILLPRDSTTIWRGNE